VTKLLLAFAGEGCSDFGSSLALLTEVLAAWWEVEEGVHVASRSRLHRGRQMATICLEHCIRGTQML